MGLIKEAALINEKNELHVWKTQFGNSVGSTKLSQEERVVPCGVECLCGVCTREENEALAVCMQVA